MTKRREERRPGPAVDGPERPEDCSEPAGTALAASGDSARSPVVAVLSSVSMIDYPGRLAAVFFTAGCNFRCRFCHNAALVARPGAAYAWDDLRARARAFRDEWADGVVISGGEPTLAAGLPALVAELKALGFAVKLDTNGSHPEILAALLPLLDYVAMDVKTAPPRYESLTGFADTDALARSMELLRDGPTDYELRTTVIAGEHDEPCMDALGEWVRGARRWVLQPFVPRADLPDPALRAVPRTPGARLYELRARLAECAGEVLVRGGETLPEVPLRGVPRRAPATR